MGKLEIEGGIARRNGKQGGVGCRVPPRTQSRFSLRLPHAVARRKTYEVVYFYNFIKEPMP